MKPAPNPYASPIEEPNVLQRKAQHVSVWWALRRSIAWACAGLGIGLVLGLAAGYFVYPSFPGYFNNIICPPEMWHVMRLGETYDEKSHIVTCITSAQNGASSGFFLGLAIPWLIWGNVNFQWTGQKN